ncbi:hypothetical protein EV702DRAFT_1043873 [Suillus placidus]|uniref:Uncharacterized protein n=1 Tax=Suillus placidus TaxID=48579 RepID=A0A9P7A0D7_9AGAM|nr:hypothetical protein EV702DRAFT_1043873 [Suillus placidus]
MSLMRGRGLAAAKYWRPRTSSMPSTMSGNLGLVMLHFSALDPLIVKLRTPAYPQTVAVMQLEAWVGEMGIHLIFCLQAQLIGSVATGGYISPAKTRKPQFISFSINAAMSLRSLQIPWSTGGAAAIMISASFDISVARDTV